MGQVVGVDAARRGRGSRRRRRRTTTSTAVSGGLNFNALSSRLVIARSSSVTRPTTIAGRSVVERDVAAGPPLLAGHDAVDELAEVDLLDGFFGVGVGGELDELAHEVGELPQLEVGLAEQLVALVLVERPRPPEQVDVRAQRGERRAQLVARVQHESALLLARRAQARRACC